MSPLKLTRPIRRTAALLCAAFAGLGLAGPAAAQTGPLPTSPPHPVPFQSPLYHSGGASTPYPTTAADAPYLTPLIDPLQSQFQGTPTELYNGSLTQIPSYLLGNYDPTRPPAGLLGGINVYYPNHFADGQNPPYQWEAPFSYVAQSASTVTVDDNALPPTAGTSGFTATGGFTSVNNATTFPAAGTATNGEYLLLPYNTNGSAVWTLYQAIAGNYSLYFHIPNDLPSAAGVPEVRDTQVTYFIAVRDAGGNVTTSTSATASQTEANDTQFLAGPFQVVAGGTVTVTLTRSTTAPLINDNLITPDVLVADSMTLQVAVGDVQSAPTAITYDLYPNDFNSAKLQYWGIFVPPVASLMPGVPQPVGTAVNSNANPDTTGAAFGAAAINGGNILLKTGNPTNALNPAGAADPLRRIRQLVYFGRSDPTATISNSVDDSSTTNFTSSPFTPVNPAPTASNNEYKKFGTAEGIPVTPVAAWTVPTPSGTAPVFVYAHIPATPTGEIRSNRVYYTVTETTAAGIVTTAPVAISQVTTGSDALIVLPTGPLSPVAGSNIIVQMYNVNDSTTTAPPNGSVVVADSVTVSTGSGQGAIYCVDGFNGGVVWRYETPGSANGASAPVFASPAIVKINVMVTPPVYTGTTITTPAVYANKLVAIVGDNNGLVYCLDAIGNGDGTSNVNVLAKDINGNPIPGEPVTIPQPAYGATVAPLVAGTLATTAALTAHVGTTGVYWIYRPDINRPKYITGTNAGLLKPIDPTTDLPVPQAFNTASPNVFVDPTVNTTPDVNNKLASNAIVYIGNSNGVLYALDALGAPINGNSAADFYATGDTFNASQDLQSSVLFSKAAIPSAQPLWWFSLRGPDPNSPSNASAADIESAPAIYVKATTTGAVTKYAPTVYIGSAHEMETTSNVGRLYALNGLAGPSGDNGRVSPLTQPNPTLTGYTGPGSFNYNVGQIPQTGKTDTADWSFPDANNTKTGPLVGFKAQSSNNLARPALGNITGSPVVFTNLNETVTHTNADGSPRQTRIYIAANSGYESSATTPTPVVRPDDTQTGRLWAVNLDGSVGTTTNGAIGTTTTNLATGVWAYPLAFDPNNASFDNTPQPYSPIGSFLRATPAIGFVQFPATTTNGDGSAYNPTDVIGGISGRSVPMLYVGTRGVNDTALYAIDIDGGMISPTTALTSSGTAVSDQRTIYRVVSPDGSIFQSSPALITNATTTGGNGGGVYAVAGNTLYDYSATPISNPFGAGQQYPLIRENQAYVGFGPISSPALAGANVADITNPTFNTYTIGGVVYNTTDWVYVGDSSTGYCRGITPDDSGYGGIPLGLNQIIPPAVNGLSTELLNAFIQTFLVKNQASVSSSDAEPVGISAPLPVFDWGESAYVRFSNVAPPNPANDTNLYVHDSTLYPDLTAASSSNPIPFYTSDGTTAQTVTFSLSDADTTTTTPLLLDNGSVNPRIITTPPDGFIVDKGSLASATPPFSADVVKIVENMVANNGNRYLGTYTYTISDGTARNNSPGARRRFQNVQQVVTEYDYTGGPLNVAGSYAKKGTVVIGGDATNENIVTKPGGGAFSKVAAVDQPTFGILNPLAARGGGVNLLAPGSNVVQIGEGLGPFRSVNSPPTLSTNAAGTTSTTAGDSFALQALTNGNDVLTVAPPSSSGVGGKPTILPNATNGDPNGVNTPTTPYVVVTATGLIPHNTTGDNSDASTKLPTKPLPPTGQIAGTSTDGLVVGVNTTFAGYSLDLFDRGALFNLGQTLRAKMGVSTLNPFAPPSGRDGIYWNSNLGGSNPDTTGHDAVINFLPWETPPVPYYISNMANGSQDYPDIAPGNIVENAGSEPVFGGTTTNTGGDLTSNNVTLTQGVIKNGVRVVTGDPVQVQISIPHYQPPNQQLYHQFVSDAGKVYNSNGQIAPVTISPAKDNLDKMTNAKDILFPMGYATVKRVYVPSATGAYNPQRPYRDVRIYTSVPIDMRTSIVNPVTDIGKVPAAFGVQTEQYTIANNPAAIDPLGLFTPYNAAFQSNFKPLEIHNDGNVNLLNVHMDQKYTTPNGGFTLLLNSDANDPLSFLGGYDIPPAGAASGVTGPHTGMLPTATIPVPEMPFLIRSSIDTDLVKAYGRNPAIVNNILLANSNTTYLGATFHKPTAGGSQPSILTVPDDPESYVAGASLDSAPNGMPTISSNLNTALKAPPYVSMAVPFGTPVGTYRTATAQQPASLRLFEGLDPATPNAYNLSVPTAQNPVSVPAFLYPPQYGGAVGGIGTPSSVPTDVYMVGLQPISTFGTELTATVLEQRLTDGATFGAVPMIDTTPAAAGAGNNPTAQSTPDFAPAAFRDPATGNLSVYWTSGRSAAGYGIYGSNLPFIKDPAANMTGTGYFLPTNSAGQWWNSIGGFTGTALKPVLPIVAGGPVYSGLSITPGAGTNYAFNVGVTTAPYSNTLYSYTADPTTGALSNPQAITPLSDSSQVKYGVVGVSTVGFANPVWAFWTASTHGRTALYYTVESPTGVWPLTSTLLPIPAGLTAVADASPMLIDDTVNGVGTSTIEVTYSGTAPDGSVDLYVSRYVRDQTTPSKLDLVASPAVTENLLAVGGWYQARDTAWSRTGALNVSLIYQDANKVTQTRSLLYSAAPASTPLFTKAIYDKASGLLVLTGVKVPQVPQMGNGATLPDTTNTVYVDSATGRIRFSPALLTATTQNFAQIRATFSPLARRLTFEKDRRANTAPVTFVDTSNIVLTASTVPGSLLTQQPYIAADRRWIIWRKSGVSGVPSTASLYFKTQRLTFFLPTGVDVTKPVTILVNGAPYTITVDIDYLRGRIYFPIASALEGETADVTYTPLGATTPTHILADPSNTIQWQDEPLANIAAVIADSAAGLDNVVENAVPIDTAVNENNVAAFLDPFAGASLTNSHKVWLFWNSTRNGTADIYSETIEPRFEPGQ